MTAVHRDRLVLALYAPWPGIQLLMPRGQIVSGDLPLLTDGQTPQNYNLNIMIAGNCRTVQIFTYRISLNCSRIGYLAQT